jgi:hypothetical protein
MRGELVWHHCSSLSHRGAPGEPAGSVGGGELCNIASKDYLCEMADHCCAPPPLELDPHRGNNAYRRVLWAALAINGAMFLEPISKLLVAVDRL